MYASPRLTTRRRLAEVADEWTWPCVFFFFFLCAFVKEGLGDEGHLPRSAFVTRPGWDKKKKKRKKHRSRRREGKKRGEALSSSSSSSSFLLARSVWPAFVRHSGVIYHVRDAWSSPCQGNTTQPRRHRSPGECVCESVCESVWVCVQGLSDYGMHNTAQVWGKPVITPIGEIARDPPFWFQLSLFYTYFFSLLSLTAATCM